MDATERRGALSSTASATLAEAARTAKDQRLPLVAFIASSGADVTEGMAALHGWGQAARAIADCSGVVPVIAVLDGPAVSGPALLIGLADFVVMTGQSYAYVSGPAMVAEFTGVVVDNDELGGATAHARFSGAATVVVPDTAAAEVTVAELLGYLPAHTDEEPPRWPTSDPPDRPTPEAGAVLPTTAVGQLRRARRDEARSSTTAWCSSCGAGGRRTWSRPSPRWTGDRWGSWPTSPWPSPAPSTSRPRRRGRGSWRSATRSTCRSSRSSTRPASTPARTSSGAG